MEEEKRRETLADEDVKEIRRLYNEDNVGYADLVEEFGLSFKYVGELIANRARFDKDYMRTNFRSGAKKLSDEDVGAIRDLYNKEHVSIAQIAEDYDISTAYVGSLIANKYRIDKNYVRTYFAGNRKPRLTKKDISEMRRLFNRKNVSLVQLSKDYNRELWYIRDIIANKKHPNKRYVQTRFEQGNTKKFGPKLPRRKAGVITDEAAKQIREGYNIYNWSYKYLSDNYGVSVSTLRKLICNLSHIDPNYQQKRFS